MKRNKRKVYGKSVSLPSDRDGSEVVKLDNGAKLYVGAGQDQGQRPYQEDSFGLSSLNDGQSKEKGFLAVLADGMGGLKNGSQVSNDTVMGLLTAFDSSPEGFSSPMCMKEQALSLNLALSKKYCPDGKIASGSTLVEVLIKNGEMYWLCIGDSRVYLLRGGRLWQLNEDHDCLNEDFNDVIEKHISVQNVYSNPKRDALCGCIGNASFNKPDVNLRPLILQDGDKILLCSDGVYNSMNTGELESALKYGSVSAVKKIVQEIIIKNRTYQDNLTVIVIEYKREVLK